MISKLWAIAASAMILAQGCAEDHSEPPQVRGYVAFDADVVQDFGIVPVGSFVSRNVELRNIDNADLSLRVLGTTCGCLNVSLEPAVIRPGATCVVSFGMEVTLGTYASSVRHGIRVGVAALDSDQIVQELPFLIDFTPDAEFLVYPTQLDVSVNRGERFILDVYVRPSILKDIGVREEQCSFPDAICAEVVAESHSFGTLLRLYGRCPSIGRFDGYLQFETNSEKYSKVRVPITLRVQPSLRASPPGIVFVDGNRAHLIAIRGDIGEIASIIVVPSDAPLVVSELDDNGTLSIQMMPTEAGAAGEASIQFESADGSILLRIPVAWIL